MATKSQIRMSKQEENLTDTNIKKVLLLLEPEEGKPITKTLACQILCISYNVKRLDSILTRFKEQLEFRDRQMKANRGKPATPDEVSYIVRQYMRGDPVAQISKELFRGTQFVNAILELHDVPVKPRVQDYFRPELVPESASRKEFAIGERVYSARYDTLAIIKSETKMIAGDKVYSIYLSDDKWQMWAYQPASELASLDCITKLGIIL